jgi:hypothetical protein
MVQDQTSCCKPHVPPGRRYPQVPDTTTGQTTVYIRPKVTAVCVCQRICVYTHKYKAIGSRPKNPRTYSVVNSELLGAFAQPVVDIINSHYPRFISVQRPCSWGGGGLLTADISTPFCTKQQSFRSWALTWLLWNNEKSFISSLFENFSVRQSLLMIHYSCSGMVFLSPMSRHSEVLCFLFRNTTKRVGSIHFWKNMIIW